MNRNSIKLAAVAALFGATAFAQAAPTNPLHPAYFQDKVPAVQAATSGTEVVKFRAANPLHPAYYAGKFEAPAFVGTAAVTAPVERNPLHPRFAR